MGTADLLGAHMSIAGGLHLALERGRAVGCSVVQLFLKNQVQWAARPLTDADVNAFKQAQRATGIRLAFAHSTYLINLASPAEAEWRRAVDAFADELERAEALGLPFVVIHPGSHKGSGLEAGICRILAALDDLTRRTKGYRVRIVLENTAGAGHTVGARFEDLRSILERAAAPERLGICLDTCHLFAAGYDIRTARGYARTMEACDRTVGSHSVVAFHLNDAKAGLGSGLDRHEHIGKGHVGLGAFRRLLNDRRFAGVPMVLETPKEDDIADVRNLRTLRRLVSKRR
ncbi:MAG: deoxyribonuclease IV [Candidatus Rokubacteria bacterium]|nr:deoxyribonuclease IV [Candidatus Rokubacteria bacterium]